MNATLEDALAGKQTVETAGEFPAVVNFPAAGAWIYGEFQGPRIFKFQGRDCRGWAVRLHEWNGVTFTKNKKTGYVPMPKEIVSLSGVVLDRGFEGVGIGQLVGVEYKGEGESKGGQKAPRVFSVKIVRA